MLRKATLICTCLLALMLWGCATPSTKAVAIKVKPISGELIDGARLTEQYKLQLQSAPNSLYIPEGENETAQWLIQPTVVFERGGMGVRAILTVTIQNLETGRWVAMKTFTQTQWIGTDNREKQTQDLLTKSIAFVQKTFKPEKPVKAAPPDTSNTDDY